MMGSATLSNTWMDAIDSTESQIQRLHILTPCVCTKIYKVIIKVFHTSGMQTKIPISLCVCVSEWNKSELGSVLCVCVYAV